MTDRDATTYLVENRHEAADCEDAFSALDRAAAESNASIRDDALLCTCPHDRHGGTIIVEAVEVTEAEAFARRWNVGETTVHRVNQMTVGGE